jgi:hypothetical protein
LIIKTRRFRKTRLKTKQTIKETSKESEKLNSFNSRKNAARVIGIKSKKENRVAFSLSIPENNPAEIVMPLLETPGNTARAWNNPMRRELFQFNLEYWRENFVRNNISPVKIKAIPRNKSDLKLDSTTSLRKNPTIPAGIVAMIR